MPLLPSQALAAGDSCNPDLDFTVITPGPYFLGDTLRISADIGAGNIENGSYQDIYAFGYALNCHPGEDFKTCTSEGNTVEFQGKLTTNCLNSNGDPAQLSFPESNVIPIRAIGYPIRTGPNQQCNVQFDVSVLGLDPSEGGDNLVVQAMGWPLPNETPTRCSNGLTSTASSTIGMFVQECGIDVKKQVSADGQNWFDADSEAGALVIESGASGEAYFRLVVANTGTADYVAPISVSDPSLGIDTTLAGPAKGQSIVVASGDIAQLYQANYCSADGLKQNTASVEGICRAGVDPVSASATDSAWVSCEPTSPDLAIDVEKSTNGQDADLPTGPLVVVGDPVTWTYVVTNTGSAALENVTVGDSDIGAVSCPGSTLAVGASMTCTANGIAVVGQYANTATATGYYNAAPTQDTDDSHYFGVAASISIDKSADVAGYDATDLPVTYLFLVTNTGNVTLTNVVVTDPLPGLGPISCNWAGSSDGATPAGTLSPGETVNCSAPYTTTQADLDAGQIDNTATATGTPPIGPNVTDSDPFTLQAPPDVRTGAILIIKTANPTTYGSAGENITYTFGVANPGKVTLTNVTVTDPLPGLGPITCDWANSTDPLTPAGTLSPDEGVTCTAPYTTSQADVDAGRVDNTATATGTPPSGPNVSDTDPETITSGAVPLIDIDKTADPTTFGAAGESITYTFVVSNTGEVTLTDVSVTDPLPGLGAISCDWANSSDAGTPAGTLSPNETVTCTAPYTTSDDDVEAGKVDNTATATGTPPSGPDVTDTDPATITSTAAPAIDIRKEIWSGSQFVDANTLLSAPVRHWPAGAIYRIVVENTGALDLHDVVINDAELGISDYQPVGTGGPGMLAVGEQVIITSGDLPALDQESRCDRSGNFENEASASGLSVGTDSEVSDLDSAWLRCVGTPDLTVRKEISIDGGTTWEDDTAGPVQWPSGALYRITVKNTGSVKLVDVTVSDTLIGPPDYIIGELDIGEEVVVTDGEWTALDVAEVCDSSGLIENVASVTGTSDELASDDVTETDNAKLECIGRPMLAILKEVSLDNGASWHDANAEPYPTAVSDPLNPVTALYRITVRNVGGVPLTGVLVNDTTLGIVDYAPMGAGGPGTLAVGETVVIDSGDIALLTFQDRCASVGEKANVAMAEGYSAAGGKDEVSDSATVDCIGEPAIRITKQVSSDGVSFDDISVFASVPSDAWYRIIVENIGAVDLENVTISDAILGLNDVPVVGVGGSGMLAVGEIVVISHVGGGGDNELADLYVEGLCSQDEIIENTAITDGKSVESVLTVTDEDDATFVCSEQLNLCEDGKPAKLKVQYDADDDSSHTQDPGAVTIQPATRTFPAGAVWMVVYDKKDTGGVKVYEGSVLPGQSFWVYGPSKLISSSYWFYIYTSQGGSLLQRINFHTSCSQPLSVGDEFGAITVLGGTY